MHRYSTDVSRAKHVNEWKEKYATKKVYAVSGFRVKVQDSRVEVYNARFCSV